MGVLEDAIREHLELKRQHGASDEEVEREEAEALGPARHGLAEEDGEGEVAAAEAAEGAADEALEGPAGPDVVPEAAPAEGASFDSAVEESPAELELSEPVAPPPSGPADFAGDFDSEPAPDELGAGAQPEPPVADAPEDFVEQADPRAEAEPEPEPVAFDEEEPGSAPPMPAAPEPAEEPPPRTADAEPEDVLEDTPDFLQDAPEHDRLWFEQKPPRDFDFD
jgi:hypothetical protein